MDTGIQGTSITRDLQSFRDMVNFLITIEKLVLEKMILHKVVHIDFKHKVRIMFVQERYSKTTKC